MIVSHIIGGLGNQMFQYAAGRALSLRLGTSFRLDIFGFYRYGLHQGFELDRVFHCPFQISTDSEVRQILGWQSSPMTRRILIHPMMSEFRCNGFIVEPHFNYWPEIETL